MFTSSSRLLIAVVICILLSSLLPCHLLGQDNGQFLQKRTFSERDAFNTAVFLKNNGLIENPGGDHIEYFIAHDNINAAFTGSGIIYKVRQTVKKEEEENAETSHHEKEEERKLEVLTSLVRMEWVGANPNVKIVADTKSDASYNYLKTDGTKMTTLTTGGYKRITYKELYPGIDVEYIFPEQGGIKYNLVVRPGADVSKIRMAFSGDFTSIKKTRNGQILIKTPTGSIHEAAPVASVNNESVACSFDLKNKTIRFKFPNGYDKNGTLIIDPWIQAISSLPPTNMGFNVDYDFLGNLFIYGAGPIDLSDINNYFKIAKYDNAGSLLWVFNGNVPAQNWNTADQSNSFNAPGGFIVDKVTGKIYMGKGYDFTGTSLIRINQNGQYDNFISAVDPNFVEIWGFAYDCGAGSILALGGGINSPLNMGVVDTTTGASTTSNFTGILNFFYQDIVCGTYDESGDLYVIMNSSDAPLPYPNTLYKVNAGFNGHIWAANTGQTPFVEVLNAPYWDNVTGANNNWFNALAANGDYLYYYDGLVLKAFDFATGNTVGTPFSRTGYGPLLQGGIAVDKCNHVYVGGIDVIHTFTFNGSNFIPGADIPLGSNFGDHVRDIKYNSTTNLLYVVTENQVGTFEATLSTTCNPTSIFTISAATICSTATVTVTPSAGLTPLEFSYVWTDAANNIVNQTTGSTSLTNSVSGLADGVYQVQVQWNTNCGGMALTENVTVSCSIPVLNPTPPPVICLGESVTLAANPSQTGGTYIWSPGGATSPTITVTPLVTTTYSVTYTPVSGAPLNATILVTVNPIPNAGADQQIGVNTTATMAASGSGTWTAGAGNPAVATISNAGSPTAVISGFTQPGTYSFTWTVNGCSDEVVVIVTAIPDAGPDRIICLNNSTLMAANGVGNWTIPAGNPAVVTVTDPTSPTSAVSGFTVPGLYSLQWNPAGYPSDIAVVDVRQPPTVSITANNSICSANTGTVTATPAGGTPPYTYLWSDNITTTPDLVNPLPNVVYTVTITDGAGCTAQATITVPAPNPVVLIMSGTPPLCPGESTGETYVVPSGGTLPYQYLWNNGDTDFSNSGVIAGTYSVVVTDASLCTATGSITIGEPASIVPALSISGVSCFGQADGSITVTVTGGTQPLSYSLNSGTVQSSPSFSGLAAATYSILTSDVNGCSVTTPATVTEPGVLTLGVTGADLLCFNSNSGTVTATPAGGTAPFTYSLNGGTNVSDGLFTGLAAGFYSVTVQDNNGCTASAGTTLTEPAPISVNVTPELDSLVFGKSVELVGVPHATGTVTYHWLPEDGLSCADCPRPVATPLETTLYILTIENPAGCTASDSLLLHIDEFERPLYIPNAFTPNGDTKNDVFYIYGSGIREIDLMIFNRWGEKVFKTTNPNEGWDGTYKGNYLVPDVYTYNVTIIYLDDTEKKAKGSLQLLK